MSKLAVLEVPVARWLHGGQTHPILMASPYGMDILGYIFHDRGVARTHLARHAQWWLLPQRDKDRVSYIPLELLDELQAVNDDPSLPLTTRKKILAQHLKQIGYKVQWN